MSTQWYVLKSLWGQGKGLLSIGHSLSIGDFKTVLMSMLAVVLCCHGVREPPQHVLRGAVMCETVRAGALSCTWFSAAQNEKKRKQGLRSCGWLSAVSVRTKPDVHAEHSQTWRTLQTIFSLLSLACFGGFTCCHLSPAIKCKWELLLLFWVLSFSDLLTRAQFITCIWVCVVWNVRYFPALTHFYLPPLCQCSASSVCGKVRRLFHLMCSELNLTVIRSYTCAN